MKRLKLISACLLSGMFLFSCGNEEDLTTAFSGVTGTVSRQLTVSVSPMLSVSDNSASTTRSVKPEEGTSVEMVYGPFASTRVEVAKTNEEKEIKTLYILQFAGTANGSILLNKSGDLKAKLNSETGVVDFELATNNSTQRVYVVANIDVSTYKIGTTTLNTFETAQAAFTSTVGLPPTGLPMIAYQDFNPSMDLPGNFNLQTLVAKLTFRCSFAGTLNATSPSIVLKNIPNKYTFRAATPDATSSQMAGITYTSSLNLTGATSTDVTCYMPANLAGQNKEVTDVRWRNKFFSPVNAMYIDVQATIASVPRQYYLALGDGTAADYNVVANHSYTINALIKGFNQADLRVGDEIVDLNAALSNKTANCYMVTPGNKRFIFDATVMGNGAVTPAHTASTVEGDADFPAITPATLWPTSAEVLWETQNTTTIPAAGAIVSRVMLYKRRILFNTGNIPGNAVIAARDQYGQIIWTWHIWSMSDLPTELPMSPIGSIALSGGLMDRNLGALSATAKDNLSIGFLYQWGRKDPFPGGADLSSETAIMATTPADIHTVTSGKLLISNSILKPTMYGTNDNGWTDRNDNLWGTPLSGTVTLQKVGPANTFNSNKGNKSIYDPCPVGWRVPPAYIFANAGSKTLFDKGYTALGISSNEAEWYPASGARTSTISSVGQEAGYWSSSPAVDGVYNASLMFLTDRGPSPASLRGYRQLGYSVRCMKE
ncbi:DUF4906 domain-containing protein [Bacteroides sp.]